MPLYEQNNQETLSHQELLNLFPRQYQDAIKNGKPEEVRGLCGPICHEALDNVREKLQRDIVQTTPTSSNRTNHTSLYDRDKDEIIDPTAGQYIPPHARLRGFYGNLYMGNEEDLLECLKQGFVGITPIPGETTEELFDRIWGLGRSHKEFLITPDELRVKMKKTYADIDKNEFNSLPDWMKALAETP